MGNGGIYSVGKDLVKQNTTFCKTECFTSTSWKGLTHEILAKASSLQNDKHDDTIDFNILSLLNLSNLNVYVTNIC